MFKPGSQNDRILKYMERNQGITTMDAFMFLGVTRLASRIHEIREAGIDVRTADIKVLTRQGNLVTVTEYSLC